VKETTPSLLDVTTDMEFMSQADHLYALYKAREENLLRNSGYKNWTILRPSMVFSKLRYQLVAMEANTFLYRVQEGKTVLIPEVALNVQGAMIWAGDVAKMITRLVLNDKAYGEAFTVATAEHHTWEEIAGYYHDICKMDVVWVDKEIYNTI
jgi:nucleoside-diphosphate-sugar epimerase